MKRIFAILAASLLCLAASAQFGSGLPLPVDPGLRTGKLPNGFTYYIYHNEEPKNRADFYIIYSVGALQEEAHQNGLAHFLEHMAFNGSANFPGGNSEPTSIVKTLERHGVAFGRNINAYTAQDRTVYYLNDVVTTDPALVDTCLLVLHDWASSLTLGDAEIDGERAVISEEWRTRNSASSRVRKQWLPILFGDTKWATHDVIGDYDIINNFPYDDLRAFYKKWYFPANQAVAVVGDVDVDAIEQDIIRIFSTIPAPENPPVKTVEKLPENDEPLFALATDKEMTSNQVQILLPKAIPGEHTYETERAGIIQALYSRCLRSRINEKVTRGGTEIVSGSASFSKLINGYEAYSISVSSAPGHECTALRNLYTEVVRAKRFGFTAEELDRAKAAYNASFDDILKTKDKIKNSSYAADLVQVFAYGEIFMSYEDTYALGKQLLDEITLEDVNRFAAENPEFKNVRIIVIAPEGQDSYLTREDVLAALEEVDNDDAIAPYVEEDYSKGLVDQPLEGGRIVKEKSLPVFGAKQWTLSNGAKVVYAKADYDKDLVTLNSYSFGGLSLVPTEHLMDGMFAEKLTQYCGIGKFSTIDLNKALAGKKANVNVDISETMESVTGLCRTGDFGTMMERLYLTFVEPRVDSALFYTTVDRLAAVADMSKGTPEKVMADTLTVIRKNYSPRAIHVNSQTIHSANLEDVARIYRDRICDASDFTFFIIGDIDEDVVRPQVEKYIGSIPSIHRKETFVNHHLDIPDGYTQMNIPIDFATPKANVDLIYSGAFKRTRKNILAMNVFRNIIAMRYTSEIREKEGGTYGVQSSLSASRFPEEKLRYEVSFDTDITKASHLKRLVYAEIDNILKNGVTEAELENVVKNMLKTREESKAKNSFVQNNVISYVLYGENNADRKNYEDILKSMKPSDVRKTAAKYFGKASLTDLVFANSFGEGSED